MRKLTDHKLTGLNEALAIDVLDEPSHGGACHKYAISWGDPDDRTGHSQRTLSVNFQNGPIQEHGINGISGEALLAILIDRMNGFQSGPYASTDNAEALAHLHGAMAALMRRTKERLSRGVEGTHKL